MIIVGDILSTENLKVIVFDFCKTFNFMFTCIRDENLSRNYNTILYNEGDYYSNLCDKTIKLKHKKKHLNA